MLPQSSLNSSCFGDAVRLARKASLRLRADRFPEVGAVPFRERKWVTAVQLNRAIPTASLGLVTYYNTRSMSHFDLTPPFSFEFLSSTFVARMALDWRVLDRSLAREFQRGNKSETHSAISDLPDMLLTWRWILWPYLLRSLRLVGCWDQRKVEVSTVSMAF